MYRMLTAMMHWCDDSLTGATGKEYRLALVNLRAAIAEVIRFL